MSEKKIQLNTKLLYFDLSKSKGSWSWRMLAANLGVDHSLFYRIKQGKKPDVIAFLTMLVWLDERADRYVTYE